MEVNGIIPNLIILRDSFETRGGFVESGSNPSSPSDGNE